MNNELNIFVGDQIKPFVFANKTIIFLNDYSCLRYVTSDTESKIEVSLNKYKEQGDIEFISIDQNYIILWDDYIKFILELSNQHLKAILGLNTFFNDSDTEQLKPQLQRKRSDVSRSSAQKSQSKFNEPTNTKEYISDSEISVISNKNKSSLEEDKADEEIDVSDKKAKLKYIKKNAFIGCRFKEDIAQNRSEALLMFNLTSSISLQINNLNMIWVYKHSIDEFTIFENRNKSSVSSAFKNRSISDMNERSSETFLLTEENLMKMEKDQQKSKHSKARMSEPDNIKLINKVISDNQCFEIYLKNVFIGTQCWLMNNSDFPITLVPYIDLTKIDIDALKLSVLENNERQTLYTSNTSYF